MIITAGQLIRIYPACPVDRILDYVFPLNSTMVEFEIDTLTRTTCFLAQIGHESGQLRFTAEVWGPTPAQLRYEGRTDLGNTQPGDGQKFCGHGLIQITGRTNTHLCSVGLYGDDRLLADPSPLTLPTGAARSAGWFWRAHALNPLADGGDMRSITRRINGGLNGFDERMLIYSRAKMVLR